MATYPIATAAPLVGITRTRLRAWMNDPEGPCSLDVLPTSGALLLGFRGLLEGAVASALLAQRLKPAELRTVVRAARDVFEDDHPLATVRFLEEGEDLVDAVLPGRPATRSFVRPAGFGSMDHDEAGAPVRWWPRGREGGILVDPRICSGRVLEAKSFVPVRALAASVDAEGSVERAAAVWDVEVASVRRAVDFRDLVGPV
ncbi:hypothetical protein [Methylobacterium brachiatum]